jgi:hypothetical protein
VSKDRKQTRASTQVGLANRRILNPGLGLPATRIQFHPLERQAHPWHRSLQSHAYGIVNDSNHRIAEVEPRVSLTHSECRLPNFLHSWRMAAPDFRHRLHKPAC